MNYDLSKAPYNSYNSAFSRKKIDEMVKAEGSLTPDRITDLTRLNTDFFALAEQYLVVLQQLSKCKNKNMSNPVYMELVKNEIKIRMNIRKLFPGITDKEIAKYLNDVLSYKKDMDTKTRYLGLPRTIDYLR